MNLSGLKKFSHMAGYSLAVAGTVLLAAPPAKLSWAGPADEAHSTIDPSSKPNAVIPTTISSSADRATKERVTSALRNLPLAFEINQGQMDARTKFLSRGDGYSLFLTPSEAVLSLSKKDRSDESVLRMALVGANAAPQMTGLDELPGRSNYLIGNDPSAWTVDVPSYAKVKCADVYPGIDLVYYGNQRQLEYDFVVSPGARPDAIALGIQGAKRLELDANGELVLHTSGGAIRQHKPITYQQINGVRQEIASNYIIKSDHRVAFEVSGYDLTQPLVIDPVLVYSTYLGGSGHDIASSITIDSAGCVFVTGETHSSRFPTNNPMRAPYNSEGVFDNAFVTKMNAAGTAIMFNTYLGGSEADAGLAIAVDSNGSAFVSGLTYSKNFPTTSGALPLDSKMLTGASAFVTGINPNGMGLAYSTYMAGSMTDYAMGVAVDKEGNIYVTGRTESPDFPSAGKLHSVYSGNGDVFVAKLDAFTKELIYSITFGGIGSDYGFSIAADGNGSAYVTGKTSSTDFLTASPFQAAFGGGRSDGFVTKVDPIGSSFIYSTYLGGAGDDQGLGIAVDAQGNAFATGSTNSVDFPVENPFQSALSGGKIARDAFVTKLNPTGSSVIYSTYLGGTGDEMGQAIAIDVAGNAFITGLTSSVDFPITARAFQTKYAGMFDAFVTALYPDGSPLLYSTFIGGQQEDAGVSIAADAMGNVYVTGRTNSIKFPTTPSPFQAKNAGGQDAFVAKIVPLSR